MDAYQRLQAINETLSRIFAEDVDPDKYVSVGDRKTVEFGRRTRDLSPEDQDEHANRPIVRRKRQEKSTEAFKALLTMLSPDAGRRYRVGKQRPVNPTIQSMLTCFKIKQSCSDSKSMSDE